MAKEDTVAHQEISKVYPAHLIKDGELDIYSGSILANVIRKKELEMISVFISKRSCETILDYGCGPGWLSRFLVQKGHQVVGIEISSSLLKYAKRVSPETSFVVCDAHVLPFKEKSYDCVLGISILHHLELGAALRELRRVAKTGSHLMFMEPNPLNFLSSFGRRYCPTEAHTPSEKPVLSVHLAESFSTSGIMDIKTRYILFISFPIARLYKVLGRRPSALTLRLIGFAEKLMERMSVLRKMNSTIVIQGVFGQQ